MEEPGILRRSDTGQPDPKHGDHAVAIEFAEYLLALYNKWSGLILGSALAVVLTLLFGFGLEIRPALYGLIVGVAFVASTFPAWRAERRRANTAEFGLRQLEEEAANSANWKPNATLDSYTQASALRNELVLGDTRPFQVVSVQLLAPDRAKLADIDIGGAQHHAQEHRILIPHDAILKANHLRLDRGQIRFRAEAGKATYEGMLPFLITPEFLPQNPTIGSGMTQWLKLIG